MNSNNSNKQKIAFVTGITGQDGSYLAELLLSKGYKVVGLKRRTSLLSTDRINDIFNNPSFILEYFELDDSACMYRLLNKYMPDEIYNLAAQSHVRVSFDIPQSTINTIVMGTLNLIEAARTICPKASILLEDIQGKALFQLGNSSPYAAFFNLPYCPFYLTLKGYYGQAIKYQLNLRTFNASYNSFSGN